MDQIKAAATLKTFFRYLTDIQDKLMFVAATPGEKDNIIEITIKARGNKMFFLDIDLETLAGKLYAEDGVDAIKGDIDGTLDELRLVLIDAIEKETSLNIL